MLLEIKHYGKDIKDLNEKETNLLQLDMTITLMFNEIHHTKDELKKLILKRVGNTFTDERLRVCLELLNLEEGDFENKQEMMEYVENSMYGYEKFLQDKRMNFQRVEDNERLSMLN